MRSKTPPMDILQTLTDDVINKSLDPQLVRVLVGLIEHLINENNQLKESLQNARDEINRLKGEQGKVKISKSKKGGNTDISSEKERNQNNPPKHRGRGERNDNVEITEHRICRLPKDELPDDVRFTGYEINIVQDIRIVTNNVRLYRESYYSPSLKKTFTAPRPEGFEGEFGPGIRSLILALKGLCNVSEPSIHAILTAFNCYISPATISRLSREDTLSFSEEKTEIIKAGLLSTPYQHIDDTGARVNGALYKTHILCNPFYTAYFTCPHKDRLTILKLLVMNQELHYLFDDTAFALMATLKIPAQIQQYLKESTTPHCMSDADLQPILDLIPTKNKDPQTLYRKIKEAAAISWYQKQDEWPVVQCLVSDDAPQFRHITVEHALCWIHAGRTLKKLTPITPFFKTEVSTVLSEFWDLYHALLDYKESPDEQRKGYLEERFDALSLRKSEFKPLQSALETIAANKEKLLVVLRFPEIPLHNNPAELGARSQVRKRDVSLHTISKDGTEAVDVLLTLVQTAKKLGVNVYHYIQDSLTERKMERIHITLLKKAGLPLQNNDSTFAQGVGR